MQSTAGVLTQQRGAFMYITWDFGDISSSLFSCLFTAVMDLTAHIASFSVTAESFKNPPPQHQTVRHTLLNTAGQVAHQSHVSLQLRERVGLPPL